MFSVGLSSPPPKQYTYSHVPVYIATRIASGVLNSYLAVPSVAAAESRSPPRHFFSDLMTS